MDYSAIVRSVHHGAKSRLSVTAEGIESRLPARATSARSGAPRPLLLFFAKPILSDRVPALLVATAPWGGQHSADAPADERSPLLHA